MPWFKNSTVVYSTFSDGRTSKKDKNNDVKPSQPNTEVKPENKLQTSKVPIAFEETKPGPQFQKPLFPKKNHFDRAEMELPVRQPKDSKLSELSSRWASLFYDFSQDTTLHGLKYITGHSRFILRKIIWTLITGTSFAIFLYYLVDRVSFYLLFQKSVNVEVNYLDQLEFPAVTICNQNPFKLSSAVAGGYYDEAKAISDSTINTGTVVCRKNEMKCDAKCLDLARVCDGLADCLDQTDEDVTECGCIRLMISLDNTPEGNNFDDYFLNQEYEIDSSLQAQDKLLYFTSDVNIKQTTYLTYNTVTMKWVFSSSPSAESSAILLESWANVSSSLPNVYTGEWFYPGGNIFLAITCTSPMATSPNLTDLVTSPVSIDTVSTMYDDSAHTVEDTIQKCSWKGMPCDTGNIKTTVTDMGKCFTFQPPDMIEQTGPGFGLGMTVNIQQYEYTKNTQDGVGLQVLLHDPAAPPMMTDSFATSPGLYSLVTVDRTEVENLKAPWGQCDSKDLIYYDTYSVGTCNLDCLNELVREHCQCKDAYMPQPLDGAKEMDFCSIDQSIDCWKPKLDNLMQNGNFCQCSTPCEEILYVPNLSFSSLSFDSDLAQGEELQKLTQLQDSLTQAREVAYRIHTDKYIESFRVMTGVVRQSLRTQTRFRSVELYIDSEVDRIHDTLVSVTGDCMWLTEQHQITQHTLEFDVNGVIDDFYNNVYQNLYIKLLELPQSLQAIFGCWDGLSCGFEACTVTSADSTLAVTGTNCGSCTYAKSVATYECNPDEIKTWQSMAQPRIQTLEASLIILNDMANTVMASIDSMLTDGTFDFIFHPDFMTPLLPYVVTECDWCFSTDTSLTELLALQLKTSITDDILTSLQDISSKIETIKTAYINDGIFLDPATDRTAIESSIQEVIDSSNALLTSIKALLKKPVRDVASFLSEFTQRMYPRCDSELRNLYASYIYKHDRLKNILTNIRTTLTNYGKDYNSHLETYKNNNLTLTSLHTQSEFDTMGDYIQSANVTLENRFLEREVALYSIQRHLDKLYYWFSVHVPDTAMANASMFWKRFNIKASVLDKGDSSTVATLVPIHESYVFSNAAVDSFWLDVSNDLTVQRLNTDTGLANMMSQLRETESYLSNFMSGNEISESFYGKNFLQVDIYYKELAHRTVRQQKAYEYAALLGEVGGLLGLLLGGSVLTLFELIDLLCYNSCVKCLTKQDKRNTIKIKPQN